MRGMQYIPSVLASGTVTFDLGSSLGYQEIRVTLLKGLRYCPNDDILNPWEGIVRDKPPAEGVGLWDYRVRKRVTGFLLKSISESGARHILVTGGLAFEIHFNDNDPIILPSGEYSVSTKCLKAFAALRRERPSDNHIFLSPTRNPDIAVEKGMFDSLPEAKDGAAVYVLGYWPHWKRLIAEFYRCVNTAGKASGFVHAVVSLDDSTIPNDDYDSLHASRSPLECLCQFWDMADRQ